jgi:hypothetical protein
VRWREHRYSVQIVRRVDVAALAAVDAETLAEADEAGYLAGNAMFQDLSGCSWEEARIAVAGERDLITRLKAAEDLEAEAEAIEDERLAVLDDADTLWSISPVERCRQRSAFGPRANVRS